MHGIEGLHHVTAIAGEPQTNINFHTRVAACSHLRARRSAETFRL
jgi:hypothetical protein